MKRTAVLATLALVAVSPAVANAGTKGGARTLTATYSGAYGASTPAASFNTNCTGGVGDCWQFSTVKGEKSVTITAKDSTGTPTGLQVFTDADFQSVQTFCGTAKISVSPKVATTVDVRPALATDCQSVPTNGVLTAVITKK